MGLLQLYLYLYFFAYKWNKIRNKTKEESKDKEIPAQGLTILGGWGSQISRQSAREVGRFVSLTRRPTLPLGKYTWHSCLTEAEWATVRPEGLRQWKIPMTLSGIELATFLLVAPCPRRGNPVGNVLPSNLICIINIDYLNTLRTGDANLRF